MPLKLFKLDEEQTRLLFEREARHTYNQASYQQPLKTIPPGEVVEVSEEGVTPRTLRRRFGKASKETGIPIKWSRQMPCVFQVGQPATPSEEEPHADV